MTAINLAEKLATFSEHFKPRTVGVFNGHDLMVAKLKGDGDVHLAPGEMYVVPKGVEHRPVAEEEVHILLIEPTGTPNTGDAATAARRMVI
jgi:mannose-6-phosphate isomerase-like protein (cupin superfamily)